MCLGQGSQRVLARAVNVSWPGLAQNNSVQ